MKALFTAFLLSTIIGVGITSGQDAAPGVGTGAHTSTVLAAEGASPGEAQGGCTGTPPCCDFNDDGSCNLRMFCWLNTWVCP